MGVDFKNSNSQQFFAIARSIAGFENIILFLSTFFEFKKVIPDRSDFLLDVFLIYPFIKVLKLNLTSFKENEFIGIPIFEINKLRFSYLKKYKDKLVIQQHVTVGNKNDFNPHRLLRAIDNNPLLSKLRTTKKSLSTSTLHSALVLHVFFKDYT
jgi:DNA polymerase-3 subunit alpha